MAVKAVLLKNALKSYKFVVNDGHKNGKLIKKENLLLESSSSPPKILNNFFEK